MFEITVEGFTDFDWDLVEKIQKYWVCYGRYRCLRVLSHISYLHHINYTQVRVDTIGIVCQ